jgi:hypothetical protein
MELVNVASGITSLHLVPPLTRFPIDIGRYDGIRSFSHWEPAGDGTWYAWVSADEHEEGVPPRIYPNLAPPAFPYLFNEAGDGLRVRFVG